MSRVLTGLAVTVMAAAATGQALAADWSTGHAPIFKPAYPSDMGPMEDSLDFEAGLRYFYGRGGQSFTAQGTTYSATDTSHALEVHGRIEDHSTATFLKGHIGYGAITEGEFGPSDESYNTGRVGYINADFGYTPLVTPEVQAGFFIGYMYSDEAPEDTGPVIHGLRLGVASRAQFNDQFDITAEAAIIPYASITGTMSNPGASLADIDGSLYGAAGEVMAGFRVTDAFVMRAGIRGTYLNGHVLVGGEEEYVEMYRWGPLVEASVRF